MALAGVLEIQMQMSTARILEDVRKVQTTVGGAMNEVGKAVASVERALGSLGIGVGVGYFASLIKGSIDAMDHLNDLSKTTAIAVEQLAGLKLAAKQTGGDLDSIAASISKLSVNMGKDAEKFKALGVSAKDPLEAFKQLSDVFKNIVDPQQRAAVMAAALGKSWAGAAPLLAEGGKKIQEMVDNGTKLSGITTAMAEASDNFNDKVAELGTSIGATKNQIAIGLLPTLTALVDNFTLVRNIIASVVAAKIAGWAAQAAAALYATVSANMAKAAATLAAANADVVATGAAVALTTSRVAELRAAVLAAEGEAILAVTMNGLIPMQAKAATAAAAHAVALDAQAVAQRGASVSAGLASGALGLLGGPIGWITLLLGLGATAWALWGKNSKDATEQAKDSVARGLEIVQKLNKEAKFGTGDLGDLNIALDAAKGRIADLKAKGISVDSSSFKTAQINSFMLEAAIDQLKTKTVVMTKAQKDAAAAAAKFLEDGKNGAKAAIDPYIKLQEAAAKFVGTLQKEADQLGMTDREKKLYDANVVALTLHKGPERDAFLATTNALIEEIDAYKKAIEVAKERAALRQKEADGIDAYMKAQDEGYAAAVKGAQDATAAARTEYEQMGLSKSQIAEITLLTLASTQAKFNDGSEGFNALQKQIDAQKELIGWLKKTETKQAGIDAAKATAEEWKRGWEETDRIGRETFIGLALEGKTFADTVGKALKTSLASGLYDVFVKPVLLQVYTSVTGGALGAAGGAAGGGLINSALGSMIGSGATMGALGTAFGEGFMATLGGSSLSGGAAAGILATGGAAGAGTMGMIGAAAPYVGLALALYSVFSDHGTPKLEAGFSPNGMSIGGRDALGNLQGSQRGDVAAAQTISAGIVAAYQTVAQQLGIKNGKIDVGVFYAQDPTGESQTQLQIIGGAYNRSNAMGGIENAGKTSQDLQDAIAKSAAQLVLTNLQSADLPAYMAKVFAPLTSASTAQQINDAVAFASGLKQIRDALTETRTPLQIMADDMRALGTTAETFKTDFVAAIDAGITSENLTAWQHLGQEIEQLTPPVEKAAEAIATISEGMRNMASDRKSLEGQLATLQGRPWEAQGIDLSNAAEAAAWAYNEGLRADIKAIEDANTAEQERADAVTAAAEALQQATDQAIDSLAALRAKYADPLTTQTAAEQIAQTLGANVVDILGMDSAGMRLFVRNLSKEIDPATTAGKAFLATLESLSPAFDTLITGASAAKTAVEAVAAAFDWVQYHADELAAHNASVDKFVSQISSAYASVQSSLASVGNAVEALHSKQIAAQQKVNDLTRTAADNLSRFGTTISDFLDTISPTTGPNASLASLKAQFSATAVLAAGGDATAQGKVVSQAQALLKVAQAGSTSALEYARSEAFVRTTLEPIEKKAATQAAAMLATLTTTTSTAGDELAAATQASIAAQADYQAALAATTGMSFTVAGTLDALNTALASYDSANAALAASYAAAYAAHGMTLDVWVGKLGLAGSAADDFKAALALATLALKHTVTAPATDALTQAYQTSLGRAPDAAGAAWWQNQISTGVITQAQAVGGIATSTEARIHAAYQTYLGREADQAGQQWWMAQIQNGLNPNDAINGIANSTEALQLKALRGYATGTNYMMQDGPVYAHQGETITPRPYVDLESRSRAETNALLARLLDSNKELKTEVAALKKPAETTARATERTKDFIEQVSIGGLSVQTRAAGAPA